MWSNARTMARVAADLLPDRSPVPDAGATLAYAAVGAIGVNIFPTEQYWERRESLAYPRKE